MDFLERFNTKFGSWYEGLFGGDGSELRPKDVLRKITGAMEDHRMEGFDGKVYVPNKYVLEVAVQDPEERDYLLSFLDEEELESVLRRFMAQNHYHVRGPLDFTIAEAPAGPAAEGREKLRVKARFEKSSGAQQPGTVENASPPLSRQVTTGSSFAAQDMEDESPTVAAAGYDLEEPGTVPAIAWAALAVISPDGRKSHYSLTRPQTLIGRSRNTGNDLILDDDGMVSKVHARLEREPDGRFAIYDVGSTNGVKVNGIRIDSNRILKDGDEVLIGATKILFQYAAEDNPVLSSAWEGRRDRPQTPLRPRIRMPNGQEHLLASETLIGRAITSDLVIDAPGVATRHARIIVPDPLTCLLEALPGEQETFWNDLPLAPGQSVRLAEGDTILIGQVPLQFFRSVS